MKTLLGMADGIELNIDKIKVWATSFKKHCRGNVVLLCANANEEEIKMCHELGITTVSHQVDPSKGLINHQRLEGTIQFLQGAHPARSGDTFLITDVFDVVFQGDPFKKLNLSDFDIFVGAEGVAVHQEPWNADNIQKLFPQEVDKCWQREIVCSGIIAGKRKELINLYKKMRELCEQSTHLHDIKDQAALIVLISNNEIPNLKIFNLDDAWVVHCAVAGPTDFFKGWGFEATIKQKYGIPKLVQESVYTADNRLYDMVHQFNRVPKWNDALTKQYLSN